MEGKSVILVFVGIEWKSLLFFSLEAKETTRPNVPFGTGGKL